MSLEPILAARDVDSYTGPSCRIDISAYFKDCDAVGIVVHQPYKYEQKKDVICITPTRPEHHVPPPPYPTRRPATRTPTPTPRPHGGGPHGPFGPGYGPPPGYGPIPGPVGPTREYCGKPAIDTSALELIKNGMVTVVDIEVYVKILGINIDLDALLKLIDDIFGRDVEATKPRLPEAPFSGPPGRPLPEGLSCNYTPYCGKSIKKCPGTQAITATDHLDCLRRCEANAISATVEIGDLHVCLGVSLNHGIEIDNCIFVTGDPSTIVEIDINILIDDPNVDSFCH